ncbi:MAG: helix-turn-helix transcriptional regulator [Lachnospiraceae bacterium]|nr:helix-turn-helix transcriptional regulator [Lachnospiraceae bacterium]
MTLAEKLKEARRQSGLSQEQLAEKLSVSRSAIAKWESGKGMPDVENLKAIAKLLNVSVDYLLNDGEAKDIIQIKEAINLDEYEKHGKCRSKSDAVVVSKYPDADIYPLFRRKKLTPVQWIIDFIVSPGVLNVVDSFDDMSSYYLVEQGEKQLFVNVTKEFIITNEMSKKVTGNKFIIGQNKFTKATYVVGK